MADGDRFERRLCGKGWPKAYRLAAGGASIELIGDVIMTAVAAGIRGPLNCPALPGMRDAVYDVLRRSIRVGQLDLMGRVSPDAYSSLVDTLTQLAGSQPTVSAQLAMQASLSVYLELHVADTSLSVNRVQARLSEAFVERLVRHQWLDRVHDGIMEGTGCSVTDQITWDARLFKNLAPRSRQMLQAFFRSSGLSVVRAPRRTVPRREMTIGDLHQGLPVLEGVDMSTTISMNPVEYCFDFTDPATVRGSTSSENQSALRPIVNEYFVNDDTISNSFGQRLDPLLADWIDVALATYIADRLSLRRDTSRLQHAFNWSRIFRLKIPVRNLKAWQREEVQNALRTLLRFLTDDDWNIEFVAKSGLARTAETKEYLFPMPLRPPVHVALFSGGLDSFAGAANQIHVLSEHSFVFVSGATNSRHKYAQREQIRVIGREARQEVCHVVIPFGFNWHGRGHETIQETTQRTRGFVFLTLGAVTALTAGASELHVYENGVGAINLPYDATQLGTANSRGVHPLTLLLMAELAEHLIGRSFKVENPYLFQTKAEMCNSELTKVLAKHFNLTFSCDGFPVRTHGKPQCGSCTSCLLRRLSLERSGLSIYDPGDQYIVDLLRSDTTASDKQLRHLRAMEWQFQRISLLLKKSDPWQAMAVQFPELQTLGCEISLRTTTNADTFQQSIVRLYSRYISEWQTFSARNSLQRRARAA